MVIATMGSSFQYVAELVGADELKDPKFLGHGARIGLRDEIDLHLMPWLSDIDKEYWIKNVFEYLNKKRGTAVGWVRNVEDLAHCPQLKSQHFYQTIGHPFHGKGVYPGGPALMGETPWKNGRAPLLGEDNQEIFGSRLGLAKEELAVLKREGAI